MTIGNVTVYRETAAYVTASDARMLSPYLVEAKSARCRGSARR